jgi:FixJ family two-component response regulator
MTRTSRGCLIALVDDEPSVLSAVGRLLRSHNFQYHAYASAESALADPELFSAQCHILDIQLPGMDGFELRDQIRVAGWNIPCLFMTAHFEEGSPEWNRRIGDTPYLLKPFDERQLIMTIDRLLGESGQ